jgi:hypothetical protein
MSRGRDTREDENVRLFAGGINNLLAFTGEPAMLVATGRTEAVGATKIRRTGVDGPRGGHGIHWKGRGCGFWSLAEAREWRCVAPGTTPEGEMQTQFAGSKDSVRVYTNRCEQPQKEIMGRASDELNAR